MKLDQAVGILTRPELQVQHARHPHTLKVQVFQPGSLGGTPCSVVEGIDIGFDWNAGSIIIRTAEPLTRLSEEDVAAIHKSVAAGQSWHAYEAYKKQKAKEDRLRELLKKAQVLLELRAEFDPTYPPDTHPLNDDAKLLMEVIAALERP